MSVKKTLNVNTTNAVPRILSGFDSVKKMFPHSSRLATNDSSMHVYREQKKRRLYPRKPELPRPSI